MSDVPEEPGPAAKALADAQRIGRTIYIVRTRRGYIDHLPWAVVEQLVRIGLVEEVTGATLVGGSGRLDTFRVFQPPERTDL